MTTFTLTTACENYKVERQRHNKQTDDSSQEKRRAALRRIRTHDTLQSRHDWYTSLRYQTDHWYIQGHCRRPQHQFGPTDHHTLFPTHCLYISEWSLPIRTVHQSVLFHHLDTSVSLRETYEPEKGGGGREKRWKEGRQEVGRGEMKKGKVDGRREGRNHFLLCIIQSALDKNAKLNRLHVGV